MGFLNSLKKPVNIKSSLPKFSRSTAFTSSSHPISSRSFQELPPELFAITKPIFKLLQAQANKVYFQSSEVEAVWDIKDSSGHVFEAKSISLVGSRIIVADSSVGVMDVAIIDSPSNMNQCEISSVGEFLQFNNGLLSVACSDFALLEKFKRLCMISIFEFVSIYKALTGTVISSYGLRMSDMHIILNSPFNFKDWCEIYLDGQGWVKVWCHIDKVSKSSNSKSNSDHDTKGKYQIRFFRDDKSTSSKNCVFFIPDNEYVQDVFFYNADSAEPSKNMNEFFQRLQMIKLVGNVRFCGDTDLNDIMDNGSINSSANNGSGDSSSAALNNESPSTTPKSRTFFSPKGHKRNSSHVSSLTSRSTKKPITNFTTRTNGLLIRPLPHHGVHHLEAMIRFIIPLMDCARLYGRPVQFKTDRTDVDSLMFGLPKLPSVDYFAQEEIVHLMTQEFNPLKEKDTDDTMALAMSRFSSYLQERMTKVSKRNTELSFKTFSDVMGVYKSTKDRAKLGSIGGKDCSVKELSLSDKSNFSSESTNVMNQLQINAREFRNSMCERPIVASTSPLA
ncbi:YJL016W-like protein [Saccharomyces cerevisiae x Saccharomyces kudriavzevii VIN7]|uniref:YJL016W-like protein n=1 Tax=Saccharomyces cerevisiae x Saccharomyces kudriavzevii (strain VIN7) TaxID=1095631 RepID=H0GWW5_SACCK|nr:YJL016W-like protein [Saccharomyces cerevisiae x Saccharomyces kudriavzevii VIN7]